ncbi:MAG: hypothetical protein ABH876_02215 [Patescibacteria group bacterium]|nr:hypothetical protein [Patescibacteria group bacterium]MBU1876845.1 hypothetical protein [Patescibacteria group bacterium]
MNSKDDNQKDNPNFDFSKFFSIGKKDKVSLPDNDLFKSKRLLNKKTKLYFITVGICFFIIIILSFLSLSKVGESLPLDYSRPAIE